MLGHQQGKVGILRLLVRSVEAVAVHRHDSVGIFVHHKTLWIHAERPHVILELLGAVHDFALVQLIRQILKNHRRQFHPNAQVHAVGAGWNLQIPAQLLHPFAAASAHGDDALVALRRAAVSADDPVGPVFQRIHRFHRCAETEVHLVLQFFINIFQNDIVHIRSQMANGCVQQGELVLHTNLLELGAHGGVLLRIPAALGAVDFIHVIHQLQGLLPADVLVQRPAKIIGNVVLSVGERSGAAEAVHNGASRAVDAGFYILSVDGTFSLLQRISLFENAHLQFRIFFRQLIG